MSFWAVCGVSMLHGQNLVPNPSFELFDNCPDMLSGNIPVSHAIGWQSYSNTPDYYNACNGTSCGWCVPENFIATQAAHSGQAYMGLCTYFSSIPGEMDFREYIGIDLLSPLVVGETYYASMYVCLAGDYTPVYDYFEGTQAANNNLGILFTNMSSTLPDSYLEELAIPDRAQVHADSIISDTTNWTLVSGSFLADSSYQRLIIGNLFSNLNTLHTSIYGNPFELGYYLVDDICVSRDLQGCHIENGIAPNAAHLIRIAPNPSSNEITITGAGPAVRGAMVLDELGRRIAAWPCCIEGIDVSELAQGTYTLVLLDKSDAVVSRSRFVKQ